MEPHSHLQYLISIRVGYSYNIEASYLSSILFAWKPHTHLPGKMKEFIQFVQVSDSEESESRSSLLPKTNHGCILSAENTLLNNLLPLRDRGVS